MRAESIAVVVLNYNTKDLLQQYLPSLVASCKDLAQVYVADNASNDGSAEWLKTQDDIYLIELKENFGYAGGYNRALAQIEADIYVLINSDVKVTPMWLAGLVKPLKEDRDIAAVQPKILMLSDETKFEYAGAAGGFMDKWGYPFCRGRIFDAVETDHGQYDNDIDVFWSTGACFAIRSELFHQLAGFDEDFFAHMEEIDLCWRLQHLGFRIRYSGSSVVYHLGGGTLKAGSKRKYYLNYRNNLAMITKNYKGSSWFFLVLWKMVLDGASAINFLVAGRADVFMAVINAHFTYWGKLNYWINKRKQLKRTISNNILYPKSVVWAYFIRRKRKFSDL